MRVKAHAGCEGTSDISVNSLVKAVETGADIVEVDIHRTKDGFFVVGHNDTIGELMIAENTCRQLKDAYPETITLKEALEYLADKEILLNIDYKIYDCYKEIAEEIAENKFPFERIILTGMKEGDNLSDLRKWYPGAAIYYPAPESGEILKPYLYEKYIEDCVEGAKANRCVDINIDYTCCSREFIARAHEEGIAVHVWTADDPEDIKRMKEYGADSITTHWVTAARKICERKYLVRPGKQYKANMHCHTVISDGNYTPEEIKEIYQKEGYSVVAYTDHSRYRNHKELNDENFIAIAAYEVGLDQDSYFPTSKVLHINLYDTNPEEYAELKAESRCIPTNYEDTEGINAYLKEMTELGFLACYNHPYWSLEEEEDYLRLEHIFAMEIYNFGCEMDGMYGYNPHEYERALRNGKGWYAFSTDDNHNYHPLDAPLNDSFGGFIMIEPEEFTYAGVIKALEEGDFYSSMGPEIKEAYIEDNVLVVKTSPVKTIFAKNRTRNCYRQAAAPGETVEEARFELKGNDGYIWIEIRDEKGRYANTNAVEV